jgi:hypothetical protein
MHPTAFRWSVAALAGALTLLLFPCDAAAHHSHPQMEAAIDGPAADTQSATAPESTGGLCTLVQQALQGLPPGVLTVDELLRRLQIVVRIPAALTHLPPHEQLVAVDRDGRVIGFADGTRSSVDKDEALKRPLQTDEGVILIHNHPHERGLSVADLGQLTKVGVAAVIAIGHDGSLYGASIEVQRHTSVMEFVRSAVTEVHRLGARAGAINEDVFLSQFEHVVSLVLGEARVIRYRSVLAGERRNSFNRFFEGFCRITNEARQKVAADVRSARR